MGKNIIKELRNYEGLYTISNQGVIRSLYTGKILKQYLNKYGYYQVRLYKDKKVRNHTVHRLVAETFIPNPRKEKTVNHIDGNKTNNKVENLEWCSFSENFNKAYNDGLVPKGAYNGNAIFNDEQIRFIRDAYKSGYSGRRLARVFNTTHDVIDDIISRKSYSNVSDTQKNEQYSYLVIQIIKNLLKKFSYTEVVEITGLDKNRIKAIYFRLKKQNSIL